MGVRVCTSSSPADKARTGPCCDRRGLGLAIDALLRVYDYVLLDAGTASNLSADLLTTNARAVVVPDVSMAADARELMSDQLHAAGFSDVTMLSQPVQPPDAVDSGPGIVAA